jgi:hypothetical protein
MVPASCMLGLKQQIRKQSSALYRKQPIISSGSIDLGKRGQLPRQDLIALLKTHQHIHQTIKLKNMKKSFTLLVIMALTVYSATAQHTRFGIQAGMSLAQIYTEADGQKDNSSFKTGLTAGFVMDKPIARNIIFQPELNWIQKGGQESSTNTKVTLNYLELPLKLMYRSHTDHGFFIGGGPSIAYGLGGKFKVSDSGGDVSGDLHFGKGQDDFGKPIDFSILASAGFLTQHGLQFSVTYHQGLNNYGNDPGSGWVIRNNYFGLRVGYLFKSGKH